MFNRLATRPMARLVAGVIGAAAVLIAAPSASAAGDRYHNSYSIDGPCAGQLTIDGYRFHIDNGRSIHSQVASAFCRVGYDARCIGDRVEVSYRYSPRVSWRMGSHRIYRRSSCGRTTISFEHRAPRRCVQPRTLPYRPSYNPDYDRPRPRYTHPTRRYKSPSRYQRPYYRRPSRCR